ncbi:MAG: acyltransferase [Lachnospiraceae bacterium]|nr:acyltransferase [Lachnospiraceae bacterium]
MGNPEVTPTEYRGRQSNFELLRILSMAMIIAMHYMTKGMALPKLSVDHGIGNIVFWILYAFCLSSVHAYVFISGYFTVDARWNIGRLLRLWGEVLVYSIGVPLALSVFGLFDIRGGGLSLWQQIFLPVTYEHYWFATAYVMLFLLSPILNLAVAKMDRKIFEKMLLALIIVFCGFKSVDPYLIPWDRYGNDVLWFVVLYLTAGYLRVYGVPFLKTQDRKKRKTCGLCVYAGFSILTFLIAYVSSFVVRGAGKLEYYMDMTYCYNYITVFIASIGLFVAFAETDMGERAVINRIAGYTFGVYLLHDNIALRQQWQKWLGIGPAMGQWWQIFHMLLCIVVVFAVGILIDGIRKAISTWHRYR